MSVQTWAEDAKLFQPFTLEQILLHENASSLAVCALLKMYDLPHTVVECVNAEFMASNGRLSRLPLLCVGKMAIAEFEPIARLAAAMRNPSGALNHMEDLSAGGEEEDESEPWPYVCHVENTFTMAELHFSFMDERIYREITLPRLHEGYPWPLNRLRAFKKRRECLRLLRTYQWHNCSTEDVVEQLRSCCAALSARLEEQRDACYFGGAQPCTLDAIVFGHIFTVLTTKIPQDLLAQTVLQFPKLCAHCRHFEQQIFCHKTERIKDEVQVARGITSEN